MGTDGSLSLAKEILKFIGLTLLIVLTLLGNSFVLVVLVVRKRHLLGKPFYIFIFNVCVSDVLASLFTMTFEVSEELVNRWIYGEPICKTVAFLEMTLFGVNIFTHLSIAVERYLSVVYPLKPPMRKRTAKMLLVAAWSFPTVMAFPYLYTYRLVEEHNDENSYIVCTATSISILWLEKLFGTVELLAIFFIPLVCLLWMYIAIVYSLCRRKILTIYISAAVRRTTIRAANYGTRVSIAVVSVFVVCWLPSIAMYAIRLFTSTENVKRTDILFVTALYFSFVSELLSPVLYCAFDRNIRPDLLRILRCQGSNHRSRDGSVSGPNRAETSRNEAMENRTENVKNQNATQQNTAEG